MKAHPANPDALAVAHVALVIAMLLHGFDHARQARGVGALATEVIVGGGSLAIAAVVTLPLTLRRHPSAPLVAAIVGLGIAIAVGASHLAPHWGAFSDPYPSLSLGPGSWAVMFAEIAAALLLGVVGVGRLRRQHALTAAGEARERVVEGGASLMGR